MTVELSRGVVNAHHSIIRPISLLLSTFTPSSSDTFRQRWLRRLEPPPPRPGQVPLVPLALDPRLHIAAAWTSDSSPEVLLLSPICGPWAYTLVLSPFWSAPRFPPAHTKLAHLCTCFTPSLQGYPPHSKPSDPSSVHPITTSTERSCHPPQSWAFHPKSLACPLISFCSLLSLFAHGVICFTTGLSAISSRGSMKRKAESILLRESFSAPSRETYDIHPRHPGGKTGGQFCPGKYPALP